MTQIAEFLKLNADVVSLSLILLLSALWMIKSDD